MMRGAPPRLLFALLLAPALVFGRFQPSEAARFSGSYLLRMCEMDARGKEVVEGGHKICQAYISGVLDYHYVLQSLDLSPRIKICAPQNAGSHVLHQVVLEYLRLNRQNDAFIAAPAVTTALFAAYPCR